MRGLLQTLKRGWLRLAHTLGRFNTRLLLTLVFATLFAVINLFLRLFRKDPLRMREHQATTLWIPVETHTDPDPLVAHRRQF